jgi:predicted enzyme related to lactoylglutathione lyase
MANRVVHFEIPADDPAKLSEFYKGLFGWKIEKMPVPGFDYWTCDTGEGVGIGGAIMKRMNPQQCITNYTSVDKIETYIDKAKSLGATVIVPKSPVAGMGWFAIALDPQHNPVGFWQHDPGAK